MKLTKYMECISIETLHAIGKSQHRLECLLNCGTKTPWLPALNKKKPREDSIPGSNIAGRTLSWLPGLPVAALGIQMAAAQTVRGVTDTEIVIGASTDLSGVIAIRVVNNIDAVRMATPEQERRLI